jgi:hypothetical protein
LCRDHLIHGKYIGMGRSRWNYHITAGITIH